MMVLALALVTTVGAAHAAGMKGMDHDIRSETKSVAELQSLTDGHPCCDADHPHGQVRDGLCDFVCAGLSVVMQSPEAVAAPAFAAARHHLPAGTIHTGRMPALNERPPRLRLL